MHAFSLQMYSKNQHAGIIDYKVKMDQMKIKQIKGNIIHLDLNCCLKCVLRMIFGSSG